MARTSCSSWIVFAVGTDYGKYMCYTIFVDYMLSNQIHNAKTYTEMFEL